LADKGQIVEHLLRNSPGIGHTLGAEISASFRGVGEALMNADSPAKRTGNAESQSALRNRNDERDYKKWATGLIEGRFFRCT